jgi:MFS family permease
MRNTRAAYAAFIAFGALWGTWGAALPAIRHHAGVSEAQLGFALVLIGVGALPAMTVTGRAVDRAGGRVVAVAMVVLALSGVVVASVAGGLVSLAGCLLMLGAASGAADVGANAVAGATERTTGRPVLTRAHGMFSAAVVVASLVTGGLQAAGLSVVVAFVVVVVVAVVAAVPLWAVPAAAGSVRKGSPPAASRRRGGFLALVAAGSVGALAFAVENAHQSWGAVFLADELAVASGLTAAAPAIFAGVSALTRFSIGGFARLPAGPTLTVGALVAVIGTLLVAHASEVSTGLAGLALAAAGTSVLFPTLLSAVLEDVPDDDRGRSTSTVAATAYIGFILGPVLVGAVAGAADLRVAMIAVAGVAALAAVTLWPVTRWTAARAATMTRQRAQ